MGAAALSGSVTVSNYQLYGYNSSSPSADGRITFQLNKDDFANLDTIILNPSRNLVGADKLEVEDYNGAGNAVVAPLSGKIVFTEKADTYLKGTFEFDTYRYEINESGVGSHQTDSVIKYTAGEFLVPRAN